MMARLKRLTLVMMLMISTFVSVSAMTAPTVSAASDCDRRVLGFPAWYNGLTTDSCNIENPGASGDKGIKLGRFIWRIALNVIEMGLVLVAWASAGYIIYGGFKYLTSTGLPDKITSARKIIQNAAVGLILSFFSIAIVNIVTRNIG